MINMGKALRMFLKKITSFPLDLKSTKSQTGSSSLGLNAISHKITVQEVRNTRKDIIAIDQIEITEKGQKPNRYKDFLQTRNYEHPPGIRQ